jgi:hypothetical protein
MKTSNSMSTGSVRIIKKNIKGLRPEISEADKKKFQIKSRKLV